MLERKRKKNHQEEKPMQTATIERPPAIQNRNPGSQKIVPDQMLEMKYLYGAGFSQTQIARKFDVTQGSVSRLLKLAETIPGEYVAKVESIKKGTIGKGVKSILDYKKSNKTNPEKTPFIPELHGNNNGLQNNCLQTEEMWTEKYRAKTLDELVISPKIRNIGSKILKTGRIQNLLLHGSYGVGKTSFAEVIIKTLGLQARSLTSRKHENLRDVFGLSAITTVMGANYIALLDEFDHLRTPIQKECLNYLEGRNTSIKSSIILCNDIGKIHKGVRSRTKELNFNWSDKDKDGNLEQLKNRLNFILCAENITYSLGDLDDYIEEFFMEAYDIRKVINELEGNVTESGELLSI